jgi:hypothetical protein
MAIRNGLGWLCAPETMGSNLRSLDLFVQEVCNAGFQHVVHMGMGGSSLAPLAFERIFRDRDDVCPSRCWIRPIRRRSGRSRTGSPSPTRCSSSRANRARRLRRARSVTTSSRKCAESKATTPAKTSSRSLIAGRRLQIWQQNATFALLHQHVGYRRAFFGAFVFRVGSGSAAGCGCRGRSCAGAAHGPRCSSCVPIESNPGILLGTALGEFALQGRDKISFLIPPGISVLGMWLEQLIAESTGKEDTGPYSHCR